MTSKASDPVAATALSRPRPGPGRGAPVERAARHYLLAATLLAGVVALLPGAAVAQSAPTPTLVIYGDQRCPTDKDGNEIIVCVRRSQAEQFRIPKELREFKVTPENQSWAVRAQGLVNDPTVAGGTGSCSTVGPGGSTGCFLQQAQAARSEKKEKKAEQKHIDDSLP